MSAVKNAVIAAAGMGKRLGAGQPKCLVKVAGKTILEYQLDLLRDFENIFIVTGFCEEAVIEFAGKIRRDIIFVRNADFQHTKTLDSFYLAARVVDGFSLFLDGDMIIEPRSFRSFLEVAEVQMQKNSMTVAVSERISDDPVYAEVQADGTGEPKIYNFSYENKSAYEWANIVCMSAERVVTPFSNGGGLKNSHTFEFLKQFLPSNIGVIDRLEIDTPSDLNFAENFLRKTNWF